MAAAEEASITWFVLFMRLQDSGLVPTSPSNLFPCRPALVQFWGPRRNKSYTFDNHDSLEYEEYRKELFPRVLQVKWPVGGLMPYHFARALLAEAQGLEINWAAFGYKANHPHQARTRVPRVLPEFSNLSAPLPPLRKIIPRRFIDQVGLILPSAVPPPRQQPSTSNFTTSITHGESPGVEINSAPPRITECSTAVARTQPYAGGSESLYVVEVGESSARRSPLSTMENPLKFSNTETKVIPGLYSIRSSIIPLVTSERTKLQETRHMAFAGISKTKSRLQEEKERLAFVKRRLSEKSDLHATAAEDYEQARLNFVSAKTNGSIAATVEDKAVTAKIIENAEALVHSWYEVMDGAQHSRMEWELLANRQTVLINGLAGEALAAEEKYRETCGQIDSDIDNLRAVAKLLEEA